MENDHPDVGSWTFQFVCSLSSEFGLSKNMVSFNIKVGDDPNFILAQYLMPGAELLGQIHGVIPCGEEPSEDFYVSTKNGPVLFHSYPCAIKVNGSVFKTMLYAENPQDLQVMCNDIGGMRPIEDDSLSFITKCSLFIKYFWLRRPQITLRSPV